MSQADKKMLLIMMNISIAIRTICAMKTQIPSEHIESFIGNNLIYELLVCRFERQCEEKIVQGIEFDMNKKFQQGF